MNLNNEDFDKKKFGMLRVGIRDDSEKAPKRWLLKPRDDSGRQYIKRKYFIELE